MSASSPKPTARPLVSLALVLLALAGCVASAAGAQAPPPGQPPPAAPPTPSPPRPAYLLIAPYSAGPGQTVLVRGAGFAPGQQAVVTVAGRPVAQAMTTSFRKFVAGFVVQSRWPRGTVRVVAQVGDRQVIASMQILRGRTRPIAITAASTGARLSVSPASGRPGTLVHLAASGLPANKPLRLTLDRSRLAPGRSSASGRFTRTLMIPSRSVGRHGLALSVANLALRSYLDVQTPNPLPRPRGAVSLVAVGDIACPAGARRTPATCRYAETAALAGYLNPNVVAVLGDNQYYAGAIGPYAEAFDATWGLLKSRMRPAAGNHEYLTPGASDYFTYFGPAARPPNGYYSYNLGSWHIVVLNSNCTIVACSAGSPQESWLRADLASHPRRCTLAYFHHPRFSSASHFLMAPLSPIWSDLYRAGVDVVLNGHAHVYERFGPQDPAGNRDPAHGIREFIVGSGGANHDPFVGIRANSERRLSAFGVLSMTLRPGSYQWRFVRIPDRVSADAGSTPCH